MSQQPSGVDLARAALAAARAAAKTRPVQPDRTKRRTNTSSSTRRPGDPMGLGGAITRMMTERGWQPPEAGGSIIDQWPTIAPELVGKVAAVRFEHDTGVLHLQPVSSSYATQLRLHERQILTRIHEASGSRTVRSLRILAPGGRSHAPETMEPQQSAPAPEAPAKTRQTAHPGYRHVLDLALEHKAPQPQGNQYEEEARERQIAALRAHRLPEAEDRQAYWARVDAAQDARRAARASDASRKAAIARKRQERAADPSS